MINSRTPAPERHPAGQDRDAPNLYCTTDDCIAGNHAWQYECNDIIIAMEQNFMSHYGDLNSQVAIPADCVVPLARNCKMVLLVDTRERTRDRTELDYDTDSNYDTESDNETKLDSEPETSTSNVSGVEECFGADISQYLSYDVGWLTGWLVDLAAASPAAYMVIDFRAVFRFVCLDSLSSTFEDWEEIPPMPTLDGLVASKGRGLPW